MNRRWLTIAAIAAVILVAAVLFAWQHDEGPTPTPPSPGLSNSESRAKLNDAYLNYVRMGEVAQSASDQKLLSVGYDVCNFKEAGNSDTIIIYNVESETDLLYAGRRIIDGATQYLC